MQSTIVPSSNSLANPGGSQQQTASSLAALQTNPTAATIIQVGSRVMANTPGQHIISNQNGQFIITTSGVNKIITTEHQSSAQSSTDTIALPSGNQHASSSQASATVQTIYPVQYIEANEQQVFGPGANTQIEYIEISNGKSITKPVQSSIKSGQYQDYASMYTAPVGGGPAYYTQTGAGQLPAQFVTPHGAIVVQGMDDGAGGIAHTTRASPATVEWLRDNYETAEGVSLPRSTLYNHYLRHCQEQKIDPMNPASFGKLIRSVFVGLRTRRLGTRGNSKYHYYGIRIKPESTLNQITEDNSMFRRYRPDAMARFKGPSKMEPGTDYGHSGGGGSQSASLIDDPSQHAQFLGDASSALPVFNQILVSHTRLPDGISHRDVSAFQELYVEHCEGILDTVVNLQFQMVEKVWLQFWRKVDYNAYESKLPHQKLLALCELDCVQNFVRESDYAFYQSLVEVLIPNVLRPIPSTLTQAIRNFAKSLDAWLRRALEGVCEPMAELKLIALNAFAQTLRRYTSLNHLAQAARAVLGNAAQIAQMLTDLNRVDFANVQEQASWVCHCSQAVVAQVEADFKKILQEGSSLEQWADWLESVVTSVLGEHEDSDLLVRAARHFLLKWSFYASLVIRDLTLRSAASFGSFHLIRLLFDEYMFYLVEHKVSDYLALSPVAVMAELGRQPDPSELPDTRAYQPGSGMGGGGGSSSSLPSPVGGGKDAGAADAASAAAASEPPSIRVPPKPHLSGSFTSSMLNLTAESAGSPPPIQGAAAAAAAAAGASASSAATSTSVASTSTVAPIAIPTQQLAAGAAAAAAAPFQVTVSLQPGIATRLGPPVPASHQHHQQHQAIAIPADQQHQMQQQQQHQSDNSAVKRLKLE
ncbi:hypothetical protein BOX15_Mlig034263g2 [Macrostomum lignano]|uniref:RFX-type winged-helix domain-containing protein n=1 Tax=Macrostomum lignano TaxID=282301 RepID=A0A267EPS0_9PLAT|nr:hypothetical protein BOX15_Mlig034263g2 [Macrostomum lignano]